MQGGVHELHEVTYGKCVKCEDSDKCTDPTTYASECRSRQVQCDFCARAGRGEVDVVRGQYAAELGAEKPTQLYCQITACRDGLRTGVEQNGVLCSDQCAAVPCAKDQRRVP